MVDGLVGVDGLAGDGLVGVDGLAGVDGFSVFGLQML